MNLNFHKNLTLHIQSQSSHTLDLASQHQFSMYAPRSMCISTPREDDARGGSEGFGLFVDCLIAYNLPETTQFSAD